MTFRARKQRHLNKLQFQAWLQEFTHENDTIVVHDNANDFPEGLEIPEADRSTLHGGGVEKIFNTSVIWLSDTALNWPDTTVTTISTKTGIISVRFS